MENKQTENEEQLGNDAKDAQGAEERASDQGTKPACGCCGGKK